MHRELTSARQQIAQLEPQMQYAIQESRQALEKVRPEIERAQRAAREEIERERPQIERALREAQREAHREMYTQQRAMREQAHKMQQQWHKQHEEMMKQNRKMMERLRHEMKGEWNARPAQFHEPAVLFFGVWIETLSEERIPSRSLRGRMLYRMSGRAAHGFVRPASLRTVRHRRI